MNDEKVLKTLRRLTGRYSRKVRSQGINRFLAIEDRGEIVVCYNTFGGANRREERRVKGIIPELLAAMRKASKASGANLPVVYRVHTM